MFDPSKLDLDLDENLDNNSKKEVEKKSIETTNKELKPENNDVLGNLNDSISDKLENDSVIKKFEEPNSNEEKKEDTENTQNEKNIEV
jgi:hypothetical protein